jgi:heme o synthase
MNAKSIVGQFGERRARFSLSSGSAYPFAGHGSVSDFVALTKPRVMMLAVTALVGLSSAPGQLDPLATLAAVVAIAAGAGSRIERRQSSAGAHGIAHQPSK